MKKWFFLSLVVFFIFLVHAFATWLPRGVPTFSNVALFGYMLWTGQVKDHAFRVLLSAFFFWISSLPIFFMVTCLYMKESGLRQFLSWSGRILSVLCLLGSFVAIYDLVNLPAVEKKVSIELSVDPWKRFENAKDKIAFVFPDEEHEIKDEDLSFRVRIALVSALKDVSSEKRPLVKDYLMNLRPVKWKSLDGRERFDFPKEMIKELMKLTSSKDAEVANDARAIATEWKNYERSLEQGN